MILTKGMSVKPSFHFIARFKERFEQNYSLDAFMYHSLLSYVGAELQSAGVYCLCYLGHKCIFHVVRKGILFTTIYPEMEFLKDELIYLGKEEEEFIF